MDLEDGLGIGALKVNDRGGSDTRKERKENTLQYQ